MPLTLTRNKSHSANYSTLKKKFESDLKNYYSSIEILRRLLRDENDFNFLAKVLHPLNDFLSMKNALEEEFKFYNWALKNYPLSAEKKMKFEVGKNTLKKALTDYCRLLKSLKEKWSR
jgi:tetratricopeptide (TPR) repeat protein